MVDFFRRRHRVGVAGGARTGNQLIRTTQLDVSEGVQNFSFGVSIISNSLSACYGVIECVYWRGHLSTERLSLHPILISGTAGGASHRTHAITRWSNNWKRMLFDAGVELNVTFDRLSFNAMPELACMIL